MDNLQTEAFRAGEGDAYFRRNKNREVRGALIDFFTPLIRPGDNVLEIGCSHGSHIAALVAKTGCIGFGLDPSKEAIGVGRSEFRNLCLEVGTAQKIPFARTFDVVLFGFCLYIMDRNAVMPAIAEADRILKPGGHLGIWDFDPPYPQKRTYHHLPGLFSYKMDYSRLFLANPAYALIDKRSLSMSGVDAFDEEPGERLGVWGMKKVIDPYPQVQGS